MGMPSTHARRWSIREVRDLIAANPRATPRYELVAGELLVTPSPAFGHQKAVTLLVRVLSEYLERTSAGHVLVSPSDIELEAGSLLQPDLFVLPADEWKRLDREGFPAHKLSLAIEVLSPSSARMDRIVKRRVYSRHVDEYWIVNPAARTVERSRMGTQEIESRSDVLEWTAPGAHEQFVLRLPPFFDSVTTARKGRDASAEY